MKIERRNDPMMREKKSRVLNSILFSVLLIIPSIYVFAISLEIAIKVSAWSFHLLPNWLLVSLEDAPFFNILSLGTLQETVRETFWRYSDPTIFSGHWLCYLAAAFFFLALAFARKDSVRKGWLCLYVLSVLTLLSIMFAIDFRGSMGYFDVKNGSMWAVITCALCAIGVPIFAAVQYKYVCRNAKSRKERNWVIWLLYIGIVLFTLYTIIAILLWAIVKTIFLKMNEDYSTIDMEDDYNVD